MWRRNAVDFNGLAGSKTLVVVCFCLTMSLSVLCTHWRDGHMLDHHHHEQQYHERYQESAIRNEDQRRHHQEEYAEYSTRYAETKREHHHDHIEAMRRFEEQTQESHETTRENHWNSRASIPTNINKVVLDQRSAKKFLRQPKIIRR